MRARALGTTALLLGIGHTGTAFAQCAPEPATENGIVICAGTDSDGLSVTTRGTSVTVQPGARVLSNGSPAIDFRLPTDVFGAPVRLSVAGTVDGGQAAGVRLLATAPASGSGFSTAELAMTVLEGGVVRGANAVLLEGPASGFTGVRATIDNAGSLIGTGGIALRAATPDRASFDRIVNRATGRIGAIAGPVGSLDNAGTIDGGALSAIDVGTSFFAAFGSFANSGTITAASPAATLALGSSNKTLTNSGAIENRGTGAAITGQVLDITNAASGRIASAGTTAIQADTALRLRNAGTITGGVVVSGFSGATIDSTLGTINGGLRLGDGNDILIARYLDGRVVTGVTGAIDGGGGTDTLRVGFGADTSLAGVTPIPTAFERLTLAPDLDRTVTLADGFRAPGILSLAGEGTIVNATTLTGTSAVVAADEFVFNTSAPRFVNAGVIRALVASPGTAAVNLQQIRRFENQGRIEAAGDGVSVSLADAVVNTGTIVAGGMALSAFNGDFDNRGTIRSTGGTALVLNGSTGFTSVNSGRIEGATSGVTLRTGLRNEGTIVGGSTGVALDAYAQLLNAAGGVVTGGRFGAAASQFTFNVVVANAGTINGDVNVRGGASDPFNGNRYFALAGGVLNGNLTLGRNDTLIAELANGGQGAFAGITGTVTATDSLLHYRVRSDASASVTAPAGFASTGFDLYNGAALALSGMSWRTVQLAGNGRVDLDATIATIGAPALQLTNLLVAPGETETIDAALDVVSRGTLSIDQADNQPYGYAAVNLGAGKFTNAGTIIARDRSTNIYSPISAIAGSADIVNDGTIELQSAVGVSGARSLVNSGTIRQTGGTTASIGVRNVGSLANTGTIEVAGAAVQIDYSSTAIDNAGLIASTGGAAIDLSQYGSSYGTSILNRAGGTIRGGAGEAIRLSGGTIDNRGTITGSVNLGYSPYGGSSFTPSVYFANGGTISGDLRFGAGSDLLIVLNDVTGISGAIDGGAGDDTLVRARDTSGTIALGTLAITGFEREGVRALGADTVVTVAATAPVAGDLALSGDGSIVSTATVEGAVTLGNSGFYVFNDPGAALSLAGFTNRGDLRGGVSGSVGRFVNEGTIAKASNGFYYGNAAVELSRRGDLDFRNLGTITGSTDNAVLLNASGSIAATNSGTITGGLFAFSRPDTSYPAPVADPVTARTISIVNSGTVVAVDPAVPGADVLIDAQIAGIDGAGDAITFANSGTVAGGVTLAVYRDFGFPVPAPTDTAAGRTLSAINSGTITGNSIGLAAYVAGSANGGDTIGLTNSGTITATGIGGTGVSLVIDRAGQTAGAIALTNSGTIRANAGGTVDQFVDYWTGLTFTTTIAANAVVVSAPTGAASTITNAATGTIEATGALSTAIVSVGALDLANAGTIRGGQGTVLEPGDRTIGYNGTDYLAGAVQALGGEDDRIVNSGTIIGSIDLGGGDDVIENSGRIEGNVFLGAGDDVFRQLASAALIGTVDAGAGTDSLVIDATGGGAVNGDQFVNFDRFTQVGSGSVAYSGNFRFETVGVSGGTVTIGGGQTLSSAGGTVITGSEADETVVNDGTVAGSIDLSGGADRVVNRGRIDGSVLLGTGNDVFIDAAGSSVGGIVDGGAGDDSYAVVLAGNRSGIGARTGFERLDVTGDGRLALTLDQRFEAVTLAGTGLELVLAGNTIGTVTGSALAESVSADGDLAFVSLGAGADTLAMGTSIAAGRYDGGSGTDALRFTATGPVTLTGSATGFEQVSLTGSALTVAGTLGSEGAALGFGAGDQQLAVATGGTLAGIVDLGDGADRFRLAAGGTLVGSVSGGAGDDRATIELAGDRTLGPVLSGFETLATEGRGQLTLTGTQGYSLVLADTDLAVGQGSTLTAERVRFGTGDNRLAVYGGFAGSVDGGSGSDAILVAGGSAAFVDIASVERFAMTGGDATIARMAALGTVDLTGGRLTGLAGSTITAAQLNVGSGAILASGGTINGNVAVAGTLSPGAGVGTMTVNGNVALQSGSRSVFELGADAADRLLVSGAVTIAQGSTLQVVPVATLRPGATYDLIVASGGITGSFGTVIKPDSLFGFVIQRADRIQLLGQFLGDAAFTPQVSASIAYANTALVAQPATSRLFAAVPALLDAQGNSNPAAFARLTPEPYATASQIGVDNALTLTGAARGPAFATDGTDVHAYTFAQVVGGWHRLGADRGEGVSAARGRDYGFLGGIGVGNASWNVGAFGGYLNNRQAIETLDAVTRAEGFVAGIQARYAAEGGFGINATILYNGSKARTERALPGGVAAQDRYDLNSWVSDVSVSYAAAVAGDWALRPHAGITYVRTDRDGLTEAGGSPFALTVARDRHVAGFADAGLYLGRSTASTAAFRPFVSLGARTQIEGRRADALAGYSGAGLGLIALGAQRAPVVGTVAAGVDYRLTETLGVFATAASQTGRDDHQESVMAGVRLRF
ncbi:autotransporter outer membrane beta-barrel domain-containing protein [Sphingomonas yantingensis]|uniref:autotransporter outer membrane beta-barrel domain-containing protein n=1 Tax=Sphingomonas yantingensis TaxID=1241761 RepID=UPI0031B62E9A